VPREETWKTLRKSSAAGILQVPPLVELTLERLESLSTGELIELAVKCGLDIPSDIERVFIIEELLYLDHETGNENHHEPPQGGFREFTVLPRQYHISFVETLIRDPLWVFVFWEIKTNDRNTHEKAVDFIGYCLRITPLNEDTLQPGGAAAFIVTVDADDHGRYLGFPPEDGRCFKVELCLLSGTQYTVIAESRPFTLPRLIDPKRDEFVQAVYGNPLAVLSGVERFPLIHSEDHLVRTWVKEK
jgi:hypothetical protein